MGFSLGSFILGGMFAPKGCTDNTVVHKHTDIHIPVKYPDNWDEFSDTEKLEWLKNRQYWHEFYELKNTLNKKVKFEPVEDNRASIAQTVYESIIKNKGSMDEARKIMENYLAEHFLGKVRNERTQAEINGVIRYVNDFLTCHKVEIEYLSHEPLQIFSKFVFEDS